MRSSVKAWLRGWMILAGAALLIFGAGCSHQPRHRVAEAEQLYLNARYDEAIPMLKESLLAEPEDAAAHFYLGSCFRLAGGKNRWLAPAEGEIRTALAIFRRGGGESPIPRFNGTYFELRCHLELANIYLAQLLAMAEVGAQPALLQAQISKIETAVEEARRVAPDNPETLQLEDLLQSARALLQPARDNRRPAGGSPFRNPSTQRL